MTDYGQIRTVLRSLNDGFSAFDGWRCGECGGPVAVRGSAVTCKRCGHPASAR
jgi:rubrerythrin